MPRANRVKIVEIEDAKFALLPYVLATYVRNCWGVLCCPRRHFDDNLRHRCRGVHCPTVDVEQRRLPRQSALKSFVLQEGVPDHVNEVSCVRWVDYPEAFGEPERCCISAQCSMRDRMKGPTNNPCPSTTMGLIFLNPTDQSFGARHHLARGASV